MKAIYLLIIATLLHGTPLKAQTWKTDFSGTWVLIPASIQMISGDLLPNPMPKQLAVRQTADSLSAVILTGDISVNQKISLIGKPQESRTVSGRKKITFNAWGDEGKILVITSILYDAADTTREVTRQTEIWALSQNNGKQVLALIHKSVDLETATTWACSATYEKQIIK